MTVDNFLQQLNNYPETIEFNDTMAVIDSLYEFSETEFVNAGLVNSAGQNSGSCKLFAFAQRQNLSKEQTLACFGGYYRDDVLKHLEGEDHQNIRHFMVHGWDGISFAHFPLTEK